MEKLICGDAQLSKADEDLATAYSQALKESYDPALIKKLQREWLADVRKRCNDADCLTSAYSSRLAQLPSSKNDAVQNSAPSSSVVIKAVSNGSYSLPFVETVPPAVGQYINKQVWKGILDILAPATFKAAQDTLTHLPPMKSLISATYSVPRNDGRTLVLAFEIEGCGAYCESGREAFIFEVRTGQSVQTGKLITDEGRSILAPRMKSKLIKRARAIVEGLKKTPSETDQDGLDMYEQCLKEWDEWPAANMLSVGLDGGAVFSFGNCSNHAMRPYDALDNLYESVTLSEVKPYLSAYGRSLILGEGDVRVPAP